MTQHVKHDHVREHRMEHGVVRWFVTAGGARYTHYDCERRLKAATSGVFRWFNRAVKTRTTWNDDVEMNRDQIRDLRSALEELQDYVEHAQRYLDEVEGVDRRAERIKALRNVSGRTPAEAAVYLAKADHLEAGAV